MERKARQALISEILNTRRVEGQDALKALLAGEGLAVSQASLSRDLKDLGAQRVREPDGSYVYTLPEARPAAASEEVFRRRFHTSAVGVRRSGFVVLIFTPPGEAQLVGRLLDQSRFPALLGTVAGDDTVIGIADSPKGAAAIHKELEELLT